MGLYLRKKLCSKRSGHIESNDIDTAYRAREMSPAFREWVMRVGVYLGRHAGGGGGIGVYARGLARSLPVLLEHQAHSDDEIVLYGDRTVLTEELCAALGNGTVLCAEADGFFSRGASSYFRRLPNGARARVLLRILPRFGTHHLGMVYDQLTLPILFRRDRLDLAHATANHLLLLSACPQVVTVHDLFQGWPLVRANTDSSSGREDARTGLAACYRLFFTMQFRRRISVITDTNAIAKDISRRFHFDPGSIQTIRLGLDEAFFDLLQETAAADDLKVRAEEFLERFQIRPGYLLLLGSLDPRKNLANSLLAWRELPDSIRAVGLVVRCESKRVEAVVRRACVEDIAKGRVQLLGWLDRAELPLLYLNARALLVPTLAEGFGLPAAEAQALLLPVVTGPLEGDGDRTTCDPNNLQSIKQAIQAVCDNLGPADKLFAERLVALQRKLAERNVRTMVDTARETFAAYRDILLRARGGAGR